MSKSRKQSTMPGGSLNGDLSLEETKTPAAAIFPAGLEATLGKSVKDATALAEKSPFDFLVPDSTLQLHSRRCAHGFLGLGLRFQPKHPQFLDRIQYDPLDHEQFWEAMLLFLNPTVSQAEHLLREPNPFGLPGESAADSDALLVETPGTKDEYDDADEDDEDDVDEDEDEDDEDDVDEEDVDEDEEEEEDVHEDEDENENDDYEDDNEDDDLSEGDADASAPKLDKKELAKLKAKKVKDELEGHEKFFRLGDMERFIRDAEEAEYEDDEDDERDSDDEEDEIPKKGVQKKKGKRGIEFADDDEEEDDSELEAEDDGEFDGRNAKYLDFFDNPNESKEYEEEYISDEDYTSEGEEEVEDEEAGKDVSGDDDIGSDAQDGNEGDDADIKGLMNLKQPKSKFEQKMDKTREKIKQLEDMNIEKRIWSMTGEVTSKERPVNSLLEADLDFQQGVKAKPIITEEFTQTIEEMIKKRIRDGEFDDVLPKVALNLKSRQEVELSQEKSKQGLAEIYEEEYMKKAYGADESSDLKPKYDEISVIFKDLCHKLDALSSFHFTPKPIEADLTVITNAPALHLEEITPAASSSATRLAPQEVYTRPDKPMLGETEKSREDRKRLRRQQKEKRHKQRTQKEQKQNILEKINPNLAAKNSRKRAAEAIKSDKKIIKVGAGDKSQGGNLSRSTAFFAKLQSDVTNSIKSAATTKAKEAPKQSANKLKL